MSPARRTATYFAVSLLCAGTLGYAFDAAGWFLFLMTLLWYGWHAYSARRFLHWSQKPISRPAIPSATWQRTAERLFRSTQRNRERSQRYFNQLKLQQTINETLPDAAVIVSPVGDIRRYNQAARDLLHLNRDDQGHNLAALIRARELAALLRGEVKEELVEFASPFDDDRRFEARRIVMEDSQHLILVRDVSELNRLLSMRQDFIANVSHELRTPLTVVTGYLEALQDDEVDGELLKSILLKLNAPTARMKALVEDLLLLTRLESSPPPRSDELASIDMASLVRQIVMDAAELSSGEHEFHQHVDTNIRLLGIEKEVHSACSNLIVNAVRYSPEGGSIRISWATEGDGARFEVRDTGVGIAPEHLSRLTERFYRVDLAGARVRGGTGLGLAIVKHVLKRHDAKLQIESELGEGSRFYCEFPPERIARQERVRVNP